MKKSLEQIVTVDVMVITILWTFCTYPLLIFIQINSRHRHWRLVFVWNEWRCFLHSSKELFVLSSMKKLFAVFFVCTSVSRHHLNNVNNSLSLSVKCVCMQYHSNLNSISWLLGVPCYFSTFFFFLNQWR